MRTIKILLLAIAVMPFVFLSCQNKQTIRVGVLLPLTGDIAVYGNAIKNGIELAYEESPIKETLKLIIEDDKGETKSAITAFNKLLSDNADVVIGGAMSSAAAAIAPIAQQEKTTLISPTATLPSLSNVGNYFFRLWPSDDYDGSIIANYAYNK
jgi:branched-chain amino acid transport system substrate-binding protein